MELRKSSLILISGYGDSYDEEDDDQYDLDELEDVIPPTEEEEKKDDDNNIYKDMTRVRFGLFYLLCNFYRTNDETIFSSDSEKHVPSVASQTKAFPSSKSPMSRAETVQETAQTTLLPMPCFRRAKKIPS